jgi:divalent metal cation (Fe/Co/Zn/Cd) transporter
MIGSRRPISCAAGKEASQTNLCAYLSVALLVGLGTNALLGWWWADPPTALAIAAVAVKEGCSAGCWYARGTISRSGRAFS